MVLIGDWKKARKWYSSEVLIWVSRVKRTLIYLQN